MKAKDYVKKHMPKARAERHKTGMNEVYYLIRDGNNFMYFACAATEGKAWTKAKKLLIEKQNKVTL